MLFLNYQKLRECLDKKGLSDKAIIDAALRDLYSTHLITYPMTEADKLKFSHLENGKAEDFFEQHFRGIFQNYGKTTVAEIKSGFCSKIEQSCAEEAELFNHLPILPIKQESSAFLMLDVNQAVILSEINSFYEYSLQRE